MSERGWTLGTEQLTDLARGAALLGTGGGGDPYIGRLMVEAAIAEYGPITVISPDELADDEFVISTAMMGAPSVMVEKIPKGDEAVRALRALERHLGRSADATIPMECGGINSMIPLVVAAVTGLPVVDADGMGRAFPELQMETFGVYGIPASPMVVAGDHDEWVLIDCGADNSRVEWLARGACIRMGGAALIAEYPMTGADVKRTAIPGTLSLGVELGAAIRQARAGHRDPVAALRERLGGSIYRQLRVLHEGKVTDVERRVVDGFTRGTVRITGFNKPGDAARAGDLVISFQNENVIALREGQLLAVVPDLICVLEADSAEPITSETLRYGQRVRVIGISTPDLMRTPEALAVFGPRCFGLDRDFTPLEQLHPTAD
ncbi:DUF917 domain-containing protein [Nakamurella aerolata]|uniref:DUF917 domain-containing protein n=1 Tax=Nakamurella aerolata TaxID=1656892 RepID=A0A849AEH6_9ACTN|nr:DUF917 domain-containing protein [Nakamurella aerolata]NNG37588.1 DUF917 domain-containing protein [Nakamurella aerolata]